ncbi:hypothetical protein ACG94V_21050 [Acinetobacter sp. ULE_I001]|uniref:hypothetical protein n=1 Tax=unclassified Acinetobacter TaxID=196816 RepID=UPI003AF6528A
MEILGWIVGACILMWFAMRHDKKMNENFLNFSIRVDLLENRIQNLEISNNDKDRTIDDLEKKIRDLNERLFQFEKPY